MSTASRFLRLTTYSIHRGVAHVRIETSLDGGERWQHWELMHVVAYHWYMFVLMLRMVFRQNEIEFVGLDQLLEWRRSLTIDQCEDDVETTTA